MDNQVRTKIYLPIKNSHHLLYVPHNMFYRLIRFMSYSYDINIKEAVLPILSTIKLVLI